MSPPSAPIMGFVVLAPGQIRRLEAAGFSLAAGAEAGGIGEWLVRRAEADAETRAAWATDLSRVLRTVPLDLAVLERGFALARVWSEPVAVGDAEDLPRDGAWGQGDVAAESWVISLLEQAAVLLLEPVTYDDPDPEIRAEADRRMTAILRAADHLKEGRWR